MIKLVFKERNGEIIGFTCNGHSGYASEGSDIVCAAISTLVQNVEICLSEVLKIKISLERDDKNAKFNLKLAKNANNEEILMAQPIFQSFKISSKRIEKQYKKYLKVEDENEII